MWQRNPQLVHQVSAMLTPGTPDRFHMKDTVVVGSNRIPTWYTRVSFYEEWMACIFEKSRELKSSRQVEAANISRSL